MLIEIWALATLHFRSANNSAFWFSLLALGLCAIPFYSHRPKVTLLALNRKDVWVLIGLFAFALPVYLFMNDWLPYQIGDDEVIICDLTQTATSRPPLAPLDGQPSPTSASSPSAP